MRFEPYTAGLQLKRGRYSTCLGATCSSDPASFSALNPETALVLASFPGSPSSRAIIPRMTFDPSEEGEPGRFCHMTSVMLRHPYIRYRRGRTASMSLYLCIVACVGIGLRSETKNHCVDCGSPCVRVRSNNG